MAFRERFGTEMQFSYGLTEAPTGVTQTDPDRPFVPGSSGWALSHLDVTILDEACRRLPPSAEGEICIGRKTDGPWAGVYTPALGYWNNRAATEALLRGGWLHTGDIGTMDATGQLFVLARRSDLISRGGANVYPAEIEHTILLDPRVRACAVLGRPDARLGETVAAVLECAGAQDEIMVANELQTRCLESHARYKVPAAWFFVDAMPRNGMQKIVRPLLLEQVMSGALRVATTDSPQLHGRETSA